MSDAPSAAAVTVVAPARVTWKDWLPVASLLLVVAGIIWSGGGVLNQVSEQGRRIETLERRADQRDDQIRSLQIIVAGMDAKLDLLVKRTDRPAS
jgi:hypothetical protein